MVSRMELKSNAKAQLKGKTGTAILVLLVFIGITAVISGLSGVLSSATNNYAVSMIMSLCTILITPTLSMGMYSFFMHVSRGQEASVNDLFSQFHIWGKTIVLYLMIGFFTFLWSCLFIIPGYIAMIRYSQAYYILLDNPEISASEALNRSKAMMVGYKMDYFVLGLSFIGWVMLGTITLGLGFLWVSPYMATTYLNFYRNLNGETLRPTVETRLQ